MNFKISISHVIAITLVTGTFISPEVLIILFIPMTQNAKKRTKKIETKVTKFLEDMLKKYYQITNSHLKKTIVSGSQRYIFIE